MTHSVIERLSSSEITLNSDNFVRVISQIGDFNVQPVFNAIIDTPFDTWVVVNPQSIFISRQLNVDKFQIIYAVAFWEHYEYSSIADDDIGILLKRMRRREERMKLDYTKFLEKKKHYSSPSFPQYEPCNENWIPFGWRTFKVTFGMENP